MNHAARSIHPVTRLMTIASLLLAFGAAEGRPKTGGEEGKWVQVDSLAARGVVRKHGELLVQFKQAMDRSALEKKLSEKPQRKWIKHRGGMALLRFEEGMKSFESVRKEILADPDVAWVEPNVKMKGAKGAFKPRSQKDLTERQWSFSPWRQRLEDRKAKKPAGGKKTKVGILDTGLDFLHPDLAGQCESGVNLLYDGAVAHTGKSEKADSTEMDYNGHGTSVAGVIGAAWNGIGVNGLDPDARLYGIKVLAQDGYGSLADVILGIRWAMDRDLDVLNMSFGTYFHSPMLEQAVKEAHGKGMILVGAAGNDYAGEILYPARYAEVISVGSHDEQGDISAFSNWSKDITVFAPGEQIETTIPVRQGEHLHYGKFQGTSAAAAYVSGLISLLIDANPTPKALQDHFLGTAILRHRPLSPFAGPYRQANVAAILSKADGVKEEELTLTGITADANLLGAKENLKVRFHLQNTGLRRIPAQKLHLKLEGSQWNRSYAAGQIPALEPAGRHTLDFSVALPADIPRPETFKLVPSLEGNPAFWRGDESSFRVSDDKIISVVVKGMWASPIDFTLPSQEYKLLVNVVNSGNQAVEGLVISPFLKNAHHCGVPKAPSIRVGADFTVPRLAPGEVRLVEIPIPAFVPPEEGFTFYAELRYQDAILHRALREYDYLRKDQVRIKYDTHTHEWIVDQAVKLLKGQGIHIPELHDVALAPSYLGEGGHINSWSNSMFLPCNVLKVGTDGTLRKEWCNTTLGSVTWGNESWGAGGNSDSPYWGTDVFTKFNVTASLLAGSVDADHTDVAFHYSWEDTFDTHYWIVEHSDDTGLDSDGLNHHSALTKIQALMRGGTSMDVGGTDNKLTYGAIAHYLKGKNENNPGLRKAGWWFLGQALHLIGDISVPSHTRDKNEHGAYGSAYHDWMDDAHVDYTWEEARDMGGYVNPYNSGNMGDPIRFLAYSVAQFGDAFPWNSTKMPKIYFLPSDIGIGGDRELGGQPPHYYDFLVPEMNKYGITVGPNQDCSPTGNAVTHSWPYCRYHLNKEEVIDWFVPRVGWPPWKSECQAVDWQMPLFSTEDLADCWNGGDGHKDWDNTDAHGNDGDGALSTIASSNMNFAIRAAAGLLYYFAVETGQYVPPFNAPPPTVKGIRAENLLEAAVQPGELIQVYGDNFSPNISQDVVHFNGIQGEVQFYNHLGPGNYAFLRVKVPEGANSGPLTVTVMDKPSTTSNTVFFPPRITSVLPATGHPGETLTLIGQNLVNPLSPTHPGVYFGNFQASVTSSDINTVRVIVPENATSGVTLWVYAGGWMGVANPGFTAIPVITSLSRPSGLPGESLTLNGRQFGPYTNYEPGFSGLRPEVRFAGVPATIVSGSPNQIQVIIPSGAITGDITVHVPASSGTMRVASAGSPFTVTPVVQSVSPAAAKAGDQVTVTGQHFLNSAGANRLFFGSAEAQVVSYTTTQLVAVVPENGRNGYVSVQLGNVLGMGGDFTYIPIIESLSRTKAFPGTVVRINGRNFGQNPADVQVMFGSKSAAILEATSTLLTVRVPATGGPVQCVVKVKGHGSNPAAFTVASLGPILSLLLE